MLGFVITTAIFLFVLLGTRISIGAKELDVNWDQQRCRPDVMLTSSLYGKDANSNINHCMNKGFDAHASSAVTPFYSIMGSFGGVLSTLISSINSVKMTFATIVGSAVTTFNEFSSRIKNLFYRIQTMMIRMKFLMSRVFGAMNSIMRMGESAIQAGMNFEETDLWDTITNFTCFDPETLVTTMNNGVQQFKDLRIGDTLTEGQKITGIFRFNGDGQKMVVMPGNIHVSGLHHILYKNAWIHSACHPDAVPVKSWDGGNDRPLMCINTSNYMIKIGGYTFTDYDESAESNHLTMGIVMPMLNGTKATPPNHEHLIRAFHPSTMIKLEDSTSIPATKITLGSKLSHGKVRCVVKILSNEVCEYKGDIFTPGTAIWSEEHLSYKRLYDLVTPRTLATPLVFYSFVVSPSAVIETGRGNVIRDYLELHSREIEYSYAVAVEKSVQPIECR